MNYKKLLEPYKNQMLDALRRFVQIPSVYDEKTITKTTPFGKDVDNALAFVADLGERFGFDVDRCDGYATELSIGEGDKVIGIYAHADVVPVTGSLHPRPFLDLLLNNPPSQVAYISSLQNPQPSGPFLYTVLLHLPAR